MPQEENEFVILYLRSVPVDVKKKFKAWCATHDITMTEKMIDLMRETYEATQ